MWCDLRLSVRDFAVAFHVSSVLDRAWLYRGPVGDSCWRCSRRGENIVKCSEERAALVVSNAAEAS